MSARPKAKAKLNARRVVALRLVGALPLALAQIFGTHELKITRILMKHGTVPLLTNGKPILGGTSFSITQEKHTELRLPKCIPIAADSCAGFGSRLLACVLELLR